MAGRIGSVLDIAQEAGVTPETVRRWSLDPRFPTPVTGRPRRGVRTMWDLDDVADWLALCGTAQDAWADARLKAAECRDRDRRAAIAQARAARLDARAVEVGRIEQLAGDGLTCDEIAAAMGVARSRVHRLAKQYGISTGSASLGTKQVHDLDAALDALRRSAHDLGASPTSHSYERWRLRHRDAPSVQTICRLLAGRWGECLVAAGLDAPRSRGGGGSEQRWSDRQMLAALRRSPSKAAAGYDRWRSTQPERLPSARTIIEHFGSWAAAKQAARS